MLKDTRLMSYKVGQQGCLEQCIILATTPVTVQTPNHQR